MANASATDLAQHLQRIEVDGFTILPKVIDTELITAIKHELSPFLPVSYTHLTLPTTNSV